MNKPTQEQQLIIDSLENHNVVVEAVAGSGKTTTALHIAKKYKDKKILLLVFNRKLKDETETKIEKNKLNNMSVFTFHGFVLNLEDTEPPKEYNGKGETDLWIDKVIEGKNQWQDKFNYDLVIIDEAQDLTDLYYRLIKWIINNNQKQPNIIVMGDRHQAIYEFKDSDTKYLIEAKKYFGFANDKNWRELGLKTTFRLNKNNTDFLNKVCFKEEKLIPFNQDDSNKITYYLVSLPKQDLKSYQANLNKNNKRCKEIYEEISKILEKNKCQWKDVYVLAPSVKSEFFNSLSYFANYLSNKEKIKMHVTSYGQEDKEVLKEKLLFSTFHKTKGLENSIIVLWDFHDSSMLKKWIARSNNDNKFPNELYVALSRSKNKMILMHDYKKNFLEFLNLDELEKHVDILDPKNKWSLISENKKAYSKNKNVYGVTNLVSFLDFEVVKYIDKTMKVEQDKSIVKDELTVTNKINTKGGLYESVTDITGIAINILVKYIANNRDHKLLDILKKRYDKVCEKEERYNNSPKKKEIHFRDKILKKLYEKEKWDIDDFLYLATLEATKQYNYKLNQIRKFNWIKKDIWEEIQTRISNNVSTNCLFEVEVKAQVFNNKTIQGAFDCIDLDNKTLWEFKFTHTTNSEHFHQLLLYKYLFKSYVDKLSKKDDNYELFTKHKDDFKFKVFNIRTNEILELKCSDKELENIVMKILKSKIN